MTDTARTELTNEELTALARRIDLELLDLHQSFDALRDHIFDAADSGANVSDRSNWAYSNVYDWFTDWFAVIYSTGTGGEVHWCPRWHEHTSAVVRLTALWHAWEKHREDPDRGLSTWFRDFGDAQFRVLTDPNGMFRSCNERSHRLPPPLQTKDRT